MDWRTSHSQRRVVAAVGLAVLPVALWALIGDLSHTHCCPAHSPSDLDYMIRLPELPAAAEWPIRLGTTGVLVASIALMVATSDARADARRWLPVIVPLAVLGAFAAFAGRVITAGVHGANIGGGLILIAGPFVVGFLLFFALVGALWIGRREPPGQQDL